MPRTPFETDKENARAYYSLWREFLGESPRYRALCLSHRDRSMLSMEAAEQAAFFRLSRLYPYFGDPCSEGFSHVWPRLERFVGSDAIVTDALSAIDFVLTGVLYWNERRGKTTSPAEIRRALQSWLKQSGVRLFAVRPDAYEVETVTKAAAAAIRKALNSDKGGASIAEVSDLFPPRVGKRRLSDLENYLRAGTASVVRGLPEADLSALRAGKPVRMPMKVRRALAAELFPSGHQGRLEEQAARHYARFVEVLGVVNEGWPLVTNPRNTLPSPL